MTFQTLPAGGEIALNGRTLRSIPVNHVVPAVGYLVRGAKGSLAFSGDTTETDEFWKVLNATGDLKHVIIETSFMDKDEELSRVSKNTCAPPRGGARKTEIFRPGSYYAPDAGARG
jgi:mRNA degradation ribonuclease J1/J2